MSVKGFVPAYSFTSGSAKMAQDPSLLIDQCFTRNEKAVKCESTRVKNIPLVGIDAIRQAFRDRQLEQRIKHEKSYRLIHN